MITNYYTSIIMLVLLALIVLSILISENNRLPQAKKRVFIATNILIALAAIAECTGVNIGGNEYIPKWVIAAVKAADYTLTPMMAGALTMLVQEQNKKNRFLQKILIGNAVVQIISAFQGWMIVIDDQNYYTHGQLYPIYMAFYLLIIVNFMFRMLEYGKTFQKQNRRSLYAAMILIYVGIGMQEVLGTNYRVAYLAATFGATLLYIHYSEFSQLKMDEELIEQQTKLSNDPLTGVLSRFAYVDAIDTYADDLPDNLVVFLIDINGLKVVNDSIGHDAGDELICGAAKCIEGSIGRKGQTFRIGGDEFVVFTTMPHKEIDKALSDLKHETNEWSGKKIDKLSLSVGYASAEKYKELSIKELVKEADKSMYEQKKEYYQISGHNRRNS
ncbi:GGDEF domain-containing protein [Eubacterium sp. MSJ-13]|uniref:GGDEF domain-containing protein n=1 Tax=Eubacterium sp. MSJ-13 TaxID=2841513 RepID=UPI001C1122B4|nr:GGDEF domain-containing protein [Eubacterium sp. MSJ-13]MBU5479587.1 GGDEF domain-containing protein [Eubacterium sp. MSJ-13]